MTYSSETKLNVLYSSKADDKPKQVRSFTIKITPLIILPLFFMALYFEKTREITLWLLKENRPVEIATFIFLLLGAIFGIKLTYNMIKEGSPPIFYIFLSCFSFLLFFTAMEEIAWGQHMFHFETPLFWKDVNFQNETTLHNIKALQHRSEIPRFIFGLGGLFGIWLNRFPYFKTIASDKILFTWFGIIAVHAGIDVYNDFFPIQPNFDYNISRTAELIEMMIGFSGFLYIILKMKRPIAYILLSFLLFFLGCLAKAIL